MFICNIWGGMQVGSMMFMKKTTEKVGFILKREMIGLRNNFIFL